MTRIDRTLYLTCRERWTITIDKNQSFSLSLSYLSSNILLNNAYTKYRALGHRRLAPLIWSLTNVCTDPCFLPLEHSWIRPFSSSEVSRSPLDCWPKANQSSLDPRVNTSAFSWQKKNKHLALWLVWTTKNILLHVSRWSAHFTQEREREKNCVNTNGHRPRPGTLMCNRACHSRSPVEIQVCMQRSVLVGLFVCFFLVIIECSIEKEVSLSPFDSLVSSPFISIGWFIAREEWEQTSAYPIDVDLLHSLQPSIALCVPSRIDPCQSLGQSLRSEQDRCVRVEKSSTSSDGWRSLVSSLLRGTDFSSSWSGAIRSSECLAPRSSPAWSDGCLAELRHRLE